MKRNTDDNKDLNKAWKADSLLNGKARMTGDGRLERKVIMY